MAGYRVPGSTGFPPLLASNSSGALRCRSADAIPMDHGSRVRGSPTAACAACRAVGPFPRRSPGSAGKGREGRPRDTASRSVPAEAEPESLHSDVVQQRPPNLFIPQRGVLEVIWVPGTVLLLEWQGLSCRVVAIQKAGRVAQLSALLRGCQQWKVRATAVRRNGELHSVSRERSMVADLPAKRSGWCRFHGRTSGGSRRAGTRSSLA